MPHARSCAVWVKGVKVLVVRGRQKGRSVLKAGGRMDEIGCGLLEQISSLKVDVRWSQTFCRDNLTIS